MKNSLELGLIGNSQIGALIDKQGEIVWCCLPRFDGDPVFCLFLKSIRTKKVPAIAPSNCWIRLNRNSFIWRIRLFLLPA